MKTWERIRNNPSQMKIFRVRETVINAIREFFKNENFLEVETPLLLPQPSTEPFLEVFETNLKFKNRASYQAFLPTSPEFSMKKLLAAGVGNCFQLCKSFRNSEGRSSKHNPEFTLLEWYRTPADYLHVMTDVERLFQHIFSRVFPFKTDFLLNYQGKTYNLASPWERITVAQAFSCYAKISQEELFSKTLLLQAAQKKGYSVDKQTTWEQIFNQILFTEVEPNLGIKKPTFLYEYPASQAALSKKKESDPRVAERFEVFLGGFELGNAFTELTDAVEQRTRCKQDLQERKLLGKTKYALDEDFLHALELGMPETGGIAMGVDRIVALFADVPSIQDTLFFPVDDLFPEE